MSKENFHSDELQKANETIRYLRIKLKDLYIQFDCYPTIPELKQLIEEGAWVE